MTVLVELIGIVFPEIGSSLKGSLLDQLAYNIEDSQTCIVIETIRLEAGPQDI